MAQKMETKPGKTRKCFVIILLIAIGIYMPIYFAYPFMRFGNISPSSIDETAVGTIIVNDILPLLIEILAIVGLWFYLKKNAGLWKTPAPRVTLAAVITQIIFLLYVCIIIMFSCVSIRFGIATICFAPIMVFLLFPLWKTVATVINNPVIE